MKIIWLFIVTRRIIVPTYGSFAADLIRHLLHIVYLYVPFLAARFYLHGLDHSLTFPYSF